MSSLKVKIIKKVIPLGLLFIFLFAIFCSYKKFLYERTDEYLIMKTNLSGSYDIITKYMTKSESQKMKLKNGVVLVEKDGTVTGLEEKSSSVKNDFKDIKIIYKDKNSHTKQIDKRKFSKTGDQWDMQQINADIDKKYINTNSAVRVCIIDSGIDYSDETKVYLRKNFIPDQDNVSVIYEDSCGHGTNISGIIAAKEDNNITGINSNILLYSAKVLDSECSAPISRVVKAIYWAIDQKVNIINISFGTTTNSDALKKAIEDAYNAGILIIAAAGNNGTVEYPAAYDEVMAIGSVNSKGEVSDFSPRDDKIELVAPGELILSTGDFGGESIHSGTSLAAPHVTGVASVLWQKDLSVSASFIRALLDASANLYGDKDKYGYGLVDLKFALKIYDKFKTLYDEESNLNVNNVTVNDLANNTNAVAVFDNISYVEGSWTYVNHENFASYFLTTDQLKAMKSGAVANDRYIEGMTTYPQWHGYWKKTVSPDDSTLVYENNYMASYIYLTNIALTWPNDTSSMLQIYTDPILPSILYHPNYSDNLTGKVTSNTFCGVGWSSVLHTYIQPTVTVSANSSNIRFFMYGVALHCLTDTFAHSTYTLSGNYINHNGKDGYEWDQKADDQNYLPNRFSCAHYMALRLCALAAMGSSGSVEDFGAVILSGTYDHTFLLKYYDKYAKAADSTYYSSHSATFQSANID